MEKKQEYIDEMLSKLNGIFTPSAPIIARDLFAGRSNEIYKTLQVVEERGQHCIIYGERGVGKTSLTNIIKVILNQEVIVCDTTCNRSDIFGNLWRKTFNKLIFNLNKTSMGFEKLPETSSISIGQYLPEKDIDIEPTNVLNILQNFCQGDKKFLFLFDEFDSIKDTLIRIKFADTLKTISDQLPNITIILVGVGETVTELIGNHPSLERCLKQIKMPKMNPSELEEIINKGLEKLKLEIDEEIKKSIIDFSEGFPHYTHLLCKHSAQLTIIQGENKIREEHFIFAAEEAIANTQESIRESYHKAVMDTRQGNIFRDVVYACALVPKDEYGTFKPTDLQEILQKITGEFIGVRSYRYHLSRLCKEEKGAILQKVGSEKQYRYKFKNPLLKAFVRIKLYQLSKTENELSKNLSA